MNPQTNAPALSVVVPTYNAAAYLEEALASVLAQDFADFELLVVDDCSTDGTPALLESYTRDPRVRLLRNERNLGLNATLHRAYAECRAPLIARMDQDDICEPTRFRRQAEFLREHPEIGIVGGPIRFFGAVPQPFEFQFPQEHDGIRPAMLFYCPLAHPALMFRRELVDRGLMRYDEDFRNAEDYHLWSRLLLQVRAANLPELVLHYRRHAQQLSTDSAARQYDSSLRVRRLMLQEAGIDPGEEDVALHESVILERPLPRADYLAALAGWFGRLEDANAASGYWHAGELHQLLRAKFRETAQRIGADLRALASAQATSRYVGVDDAPAAAAAQPPAGLLARLKRRIKPLLWRLSVARGR